MVDTTILCKPWDNSSGSANEQGGVVLCVKQALWEQQEGSPLPVPIRGCDWLYLDPWEEELFVWGIRRGSPKHPPSISPDFKAAHPTNSYYLAGDLNPVCLTLEPMSFPSWTTKLLVKLSGILLCGWLLPFSVLSATLPAVYVFALHCTWALFKERIHFLLNFHLCCHIVVVERTKTFWINSGIVSESQNETTSQWDWIGLGLENGDSLNWGELCPT